MKKNTPSSVRCNRWRSNWRSDWRSNWRSIPLSLFLALVASTTLLACQVPVFRYALERWQADPYQIVILHEGPLADEETARIEVLRKADYSSDRSANLDVKTYDVAEFQEGFLNELWKKQDSNVPTMVLVYPANANEIPDPVVLSTPFVDGVIEPLVDSPKRAKIAGALLGGDSAVWIFVPSGHQDQDQEALGILQEQVKKDSETLELPLAEIESDEFYRPDTAIALRLGFSIVTVERSDPKERFLIEMLMGSESDLRELDEPMAFPVFGRGRVLYALIGKGINSDNISEAASFIVGPCSCQAKELNPGFDLLLSVDWDSAVDGSVIPQRPLPELTSLSSLEPMPLATTGSSESTAVESLELAVEATDESEKASTGNQQEVLDDRLASAGSNGDVRSEPVPPSNVSRNLWLTLGACFVCVFLATLFMRRRA